MDYPKNHAELEAKFGPSRIVDLRKPDPKKNHLYFEFREWLKPSYAVDRSKHHKLLLVFYFDIEVPERFSSLFGETP